MTKLTRDQVEEIASLRERGWSYQRLADKFAVSDGAIHYHCLKLGAFPPNARGKADVSSQPAIVRRDGRSQCRFTPQEDAELLRLSLKGESVQAIARHVGRARTSVAMRLMALAYHEEVELRS